MNNKEKYYLTKNAGWLSEIGGSIGNTGLLAAGGAGLGGIIGAINNTPGGIADGAGAGGAAGLIASYLANIGGPIAAGLTPTRSFDEQEDAEGEGWKNLLVPGRGSYNQYKRFGHSVRGEGSPGASRASKDREVKSKKRRREDERRTREDEQ
jgi:hypothetical protein